MTIQDFLKQTVSFSGPSQDTRPAIFCQDGFAISVQASRSHYSEPRADGHHDFTQVEVANPTQSCTELEPYFEPIGHIFVYVPIELVQAIIEQHGGIDQGKTFKSAKHFTPVKPPEWWSDLYTDASGACYSDADSGL
jgi:hypothetical protein